jgi:hypothetical protein
VTGPRAWVTPATPRPESEGPFSCAFYSSPASRRRRNPGERTPRGAHLLLQARTRVLNDHLAGDFHRWYPGLSRTLDPIPLAA